MHKRVSDAVNDSRHVMYIHYRTHTYFSALHHMLLVLDFRAFSASIFAAAIRSRIVDICFQLTPLIALDALKPPILFDEAIQSTGILWIG